jgi:hypothetical protein
MINTTGVSAGAPAVELAGAPLPQALAAEGRQQMLLLFAGGVELTVGGVADWLASASRPHPSSLPCSAMAGC